MSKTESRPLERYFQALERLAEAPDGMVLVELATELDLPGATTHRLVNTLVEAGLVARARTEKHYVLGPRARRFGLSTLSTQTLEERVGDILDALSHELEQTIFIVRLVKHQVHTVAVREPAAPTQAIVNPGRTMPLHAAATGKAVLAFQSARFIEDVLARPMTPYTGDTKTTADAVRAELATVRAEHFAVCDNEFDAGVLSYAVPLLSPDGTVLFALGTCGLKSRFAEPGPAAVRELLAAKAADLSKRLGAFG
ncbi:IclR family transcriptional regulator [Acuticoccus sp. I52.16.1]|uniref:IclR family transcriptional regulator n=1 Tax=Acuticoccus sp. I52.16.1 TaxID=2928472 RepID=UPI001FD04004|nr:IclR family transcriptional regulator [Acuticoccus sp. I52.16.1]UOM33301.1 IclR family transcriptional regulator [Acuticoccus sp. I52.16.1]